MPGVQISSIDYLDSIEDVNALSARVRVRVGLVGGRESSFVVATLDQPAHWMKESELNHWFAQPILYVPKIDSKTIELAISAMATDLGGFWLRYYRASAGQPSRIGLGIATVDRVDGGCGVVEAILKDGREFSILSATPDWWQGEFKKRKLPFYFGPMVLFMKKLDGAHAKKATKHMAETDEQLFCRYDTPRKTLPAILDSFQATHG